MNRDTYFKRITTSLSLLKSEIKENGKLNLLDGNILAEDFFKDLLNIVYGWNLKNMNQWNQNAAGADLWYEDGKIIVQVTSTVTTNKIQSSIDKLSKEQYAGYNFKFLRIDGDVKKLRKQVFTLPTSITFNPASDIIDISSLLRDISHLEIDPLKAVCDLCTKEIMPSFTPQVTETDLAVIVKALASNLTDWRSSRMPIQYDVEKKISFNHLDNRKRFINDYKLYIGKLNSVYDEFLANGNDYSFIILQNLSDFYSCNVNNYESCELFDKVISQTYDTALRSSNAKEIAIDRIRICVNIIVIDAFIRCRIFEDPEGYSYVDA